MNKKQEKQRQRSEIKELSLQYLKQYEDRIPKLLPDILLSCLLNCENPLFNKLMSYSETKVILDNFILSCTRKIKRLENKLEHGLYSHNYNTDKARYSIQICKDIIDHINNIYKKYKNN